MIFNVGSIFRNSIECLFATHHRHLHIEQNQFDLISIFLEFV